MAGFNAANCRLFNAKILIYKVQSLFKSRGHPEQLWWLNSPFPVRIAIWKGRGPQICAGKAEKAKYFRVRCVGPFPFWWQFGGADEVWLEIRDHLGERQPLSILLESWRTLGLVLQFYDAHLMPPAGYDSFIAAFICNFLGQYQYRTTKKGIHDSDHVSRPCSKLNKLNNKDMKWQLTMWVLDATALPDTSGSMLIPV